MLQALSRAHAPPTLQNTLVTNSCETPDVRPTHQSRVCRRDMNIRELQQTVTEMTAKKAFSEIYIARLRVAYDCLPFFNGRIRARLFRFKTLREKRQ